MRLSRIIEKGLNGNDVYQLQLGLSKYYKITIDGFFGEGTERIVKRFQKDNNLKVDGVVGSFTWGEIFSTNFPYSVSYETKEGLSIYDKFLPDNEYVKKVTDKKVIYLHHTAGSHRADWNISTWGKDRSRKGNIIRVGTSYVIGGVSRKGDDSFDGRTFRAFDDKYWAFHLGVKDDDSSELNSEAVGIEICNYGWLKRTETGEFINYVGSVVPDVQVCDLGYEFRGYRYWHKYTDEQIESLRLLIIDISDRYDINVKGEYSKDSFEFDETSLDVGYEGIRMHTNCRLDKYDISPQENIIKMLNNLK